MLNVFLFFLLGICIGIFAGLCPGLHPNTFFIILLSISSFIPSDNYSLIAFIIAVSVADIMSNYIPNIFLSIPNSEVVLNILPGHKLVLQGRGYDALFISLIGAFFTLIISILLFPVLIYILPFLHTLTYPLIHILLIITIFWMCFVEKGIKKKIVCALIYLLSGIWGIVVLNSPLIKSQDALFPSLTGMFGLAGLLLSLKENRKIPEQKIEENIEIGNLWKIVIIGFLAGFLTGILPGIGQAQAGVMVSTFGKITEKEFLGALAGIGISNLFFSIVSLYTFRKIRSGAAAAISQISDFSVKELIFSSFVMLSASSISFLITWFIGKKFLFYIQKVNYALLSKIVIILMIVLVFLFTGFIGLFILFISTCIGILPVLSGVKRTSCMGFLMVTTTLYFLGLNYMIATIF